MNKYSFRDILEMDIITDENISVKFQKIEIPMIQRDYAHGRGKIIEKKLLLNETGKRFLDSIFIALTNNKALPMDFIYGSISVYTNQQTTIKENKLIPLDGQQRLTTLFLLYWYIGSRELPIEERKKLKESLEKFTYSTRSSSRRFCEMLTKTKEIKNEPGMEKEIQLEFKDLPSVEIENFAWFFKSYKKDPTIKSMLNMLDAIHEKYINIENPNLFNNLQNLQFYILPLESFNLTEDLYIKMNARGKQLSDYENFKADLVKWMKDPKNKHVDCKLEETVNIETATECKDCNKNCFHKISIIINRETPYYLSISQKMDNEWTDFFWNITKKYDESEKDDKGNFIYPDGKLVDPLFMRFFNRYSCNLSISSSNDTYEKIEQNDDFKYFYGNKGDDSKIKYASFDNFSNLFAYNTILNIEKVFDTFCINEEAIRNSISPSWDKKEWMFYDQQITQKQRIALYATTVYIEKNEKFSEVNYKNWMRFVWNIIADPFLRTVHSMISAIKSINQVAEHSGDIISYLASTGAAFSYNKEQYQEECVKAKLIKNDVRFESEVIRAESHRLFKGNIKFLLINDETTTLDSFIRYRDSAFKIFGNPGSERINGNDPGNYLWIRAMLAKTSNIRLPVTLSNGRDEEWRSCINGKFIDAIRILISDVANATGSSAEDTMRNICSNYNRNDVLFWAYPLVKWVGENEETLLGNYSDLRIINNYGDHVFLHRTTVFTEGAIILSNYRNELISSILKNKNIKFHWDIQSYDGNIQGKYFRGSNILLIRQNVAIKNKEIEFSYSFGMGILEVGIKRTDDLQSFFSLIQFPDEDKPIGWICRKKYDFQTEIINENKINDFINKIEKEVFDTNEKDSLVSKLSK